MKAIIFDWYGVCVESFIETLSNEINKKSGVSKKLIKKHYQKYELPFVLGKIKGIDILKNIFKELKVNENPKNYGYIFTYLSKLNKKIFDLAKKLNKNYKTALLSDNFSQMTKTIRKKIKLNNYFDFVIFSNEVNLTKTKDKIYKLAFKKLKVKPEEIVLIDDNIKNIRIANKFGVKGILFKNITNLKNDLRKSNVEF